MYGLFIVEMKCLLNCVSCQAIPSLTCDLQSENVGQRFSLKNFSCGLRESNIICLA